MTTNRTVKINCGPIGCLLISAIAFLGTLAVAKAGWSLIKALWSYL